jgi:hypothetical protein
MILMAGVLATAAQVRYNFHCTRFVLVVAAAAIVAPVVYLPFCIGAWLLHLINESRRLGIPLRELQSSAHYPVILAAYVKSTSKK